jgi:CRISPR system Cascade subunit CasB
MRVFDKDSPSGEIILQWWNDLQRNNGNRANLRRCNTPSETVFLPVSQILISKLKESEDIKFKLSSDRICAIAGILSHVKENIPINFARQLSQKKSGSDQALVSDIRFRRILQYSNISEDELFYQKIIRVIHHVDRKVNIFDIFYSLYFWGLGDKVKKQWAYDYYGTSTSENNQDEQENTIIQGANNE